MIPWRPIAEMPDAFKDGREVLLWRDDFFGADVAVFEDGIWVNRGGATARAVTHFAEINAPEVA